MLTQEQRICMFINFFFEKKYLEKILCVEHEIHKDKAASRILPSCKSWQHLVTGVGGGARAAPREGVRGRRRRRRRPPDPRPAPRPHSSFEHRITSFLIH